MDKFHVFASTIPGSAANSEFATRLSHFGMGMPGMRLVARWSAGMRTRMAGIPANDQGCARPNRDQLEMGGTELGHLRLNRDQLGMRATK